MRFRALPVLLTAMLLALSPAVFAEEGMWQMDKFDSQLFQKMRGLGLELSQQEIYSPRGKGIAYAIIQLGGGTGSFVSPRGLILTNHHVAFGALQRASTADNNLIENGFYADSIEKDIEAPGYEARVLISIKDVTAEMLKAARGKSGADRYQALENKIKEIQKEVEQDEDVRCTVASFYDGMEYKLYTYFLIKDIRLVYAPPRSIGNYGGDIDNWMWPRHTGDFSFFRAYVAPDGGSAEYAEENVPYQPAVHLALSSTGVKKDDFMMIMGYPGRTMRYRSSYSIDYNQNWSYPNRIKIFGEMIDMYQKAAEADPALAIKVSFFDQMLNNSVKNYQGQLEGFRKAGLLDRKLAEEKAMQEWIKSDKKREKKYGDILSSLAALYEEQKTYREKSNINGLMRFGSQMLGAAGRIYHWSKEKVKDDLDRDPGYMERDMPRFKMQLRMIDRSYDPGIDRQILRYFIDLAMELPEGQRLKGLDEAIQKSAGADRDEKIDRLLDKLYGETKLGNAEERMRMFELSTEELMKEGDPFILLAARLWKENEEMDKRDEAFNGSVSEIRPRLIEALREWRGGAFYPDANGTMRLTFGKATGYSPRDAVSYDYITSLGGALEKHTGEEPFDCPPRLLELGHNREYGKYKDEYLDDVPIAFLATCDITGGNSGSPILNGKGEVVGAAFDGNWESISSDYLFNQKLTRTISVESRYILFVLDKFSGAKELLGEMSVH
ncbi:MAG: S46 family peptidase [Candidatus Krumholzibacteriota bacterium]|nr:S46 family peptidase [Candidatus Krumholzibacteriota bacterium]